MKKKILAACLVGCIAGTVNCVSPVGRANDPAALYDRALAEVVQADRFLALYDEAAEQEEILSNILENAKKTKDLFFRDRRPTDSVNVCHVVYDNYDALRKLHEKQFLLASKKLHKTLIDAELIFGRSAAGMPDGVAFAQAFFDAYKEDFSNIIGYEYTEKGSALNRGAAHIAKITRFRVENAKGVEDYKQRLIEVGEKARLAAEEAAAKEKSSRHQLVTSLNEAFEANDYKAARAAEREIRESGLFDQKFIERCAGLLKGFKDRLEAEKAAFRDFYSALEGRDLAGVKKALVQIRVKKLADNDWIGSGWRKVLELQKSLELEDAAAAQKVELRDSLRTAIESGEVKEARKTLRAMRKTGLFSEGYLERKEDLIAKEEAAQAEQAAEKIAHLKAKRRIETARLEEERKARDIAEAQAEEALEKKGKWKKRAHSAEDNMEALDSQLDFARDRSNVWQRKARVLEAQGRGLAISMIESAKKRLGI